MKTVCILRTGFTLYSVSLLPAEKQKSGWYTVWYLSTQQRSRKVVVHCMISLLPTEKQESGQYTVWYLSTQERSRKVNGTLYDISTQQRSRKVGGTLYGLSLPNREEEGQWVEDQKLEGHSDWVRDVAWAPSIGLPRNVIATCSQVGTQNSSCCPSLCQLFFYIHHHHYSSNCTCLHFPLHCWFSWVTALWIL